jgi:hypothetical protein
MIEKIIRDFMTIWTTVDPITNLALFASLTTGMLAANVKGSPGEHLTTPQSSWSLRS